MLHVDIYYFVLIEPFGKMVSAGRKKNQQKRQLSQLNETLNDFITGNGTTVSAMLNETLEQQTNGQHNDFERFFESACQNQFRQNNVDDKIRKVPNNAVWTVESREHDVILTAIDKMVILRVEKAVRSITGSSRHGFNSEVQNPDRRDFLQNAGNTRLMSASKRLDLSTNQDRNDETRIEENFKDGNFPALRPSYDQRTQTLQFCEC